MKKLSLVYTLLLIGVTAIIAQVLLIRELLVTFSGNELSIGLFLANWLLLEALGSYLGGRWASKLKSVVPNYIFLQLIIAIFLPIIIFLTRISKIPLGIIPGEGTDIVTILYASFILLTPIAVIGGAQFSLGCRLHEDWRNQGASSIGRVYVYEAAGSIFGGLIVTYLCLQYLNTLQSAFLVAILNILSALALSIFHNERKPLSIMQNTFFMRTITVSLLIAGIVFAATGGITFIHNKSIQIQWPDYEIISYKNSIYGNVILNKRFEQYTLIANGVPITTIPMPDINFVEDFVHFPLLYHTDPKDILIIGGGVGGILHEVLKHPVENVDYAELDPLIIATVQTHIATQIGTELTDPRINIHFVDGRFYTRTTRNMYDIILINLPEPSTLEINRFYTQEFFQFCESRLNQGGILVFTLPGSASYMGQEMIALNANLLRTGEQIYQYQMVIPDEYNIVLQSNHINFLLTTSNSLHERLMERHIVTRLITEPYLKFKLDAERSRWYWNALKDSSRVSINSDFHPTALYHDLALLNAIYSPQFSPVFIELKNLKFEYVVIIIVIIFLCSFILQRFNQSWHKIYIITPLAATGFFSMGVTVVIVLAFQSFFGYIYHWIGLLLTVFMVGLTVGAELITGHIKKTGGDSFLFFKLELLIVLYSLLLLGVLYLMKELPNIPSAQLIMLTLAIICGFLVGAQFPLANKLYLKGDIPLSQTAGTLYSTDLIGAWLGGLVVTIALVPILGILETCLIFVLLKFCSLLLFKFSKK